MASKKTGTTELRRGLWYVRPTLADGSRGPRASLPRGTTEARAREVAAAMTERAIREGTTAASLAAARKSAAEPPSAQPVGPSVAAWSTAWLADRERRGLSSVRTDRGRWSKWIEPKLGPSPVATVPTEEFERFVQYLDQEVTAGNLGWKTAKNTWGLVTKAFDDACCSKTLALRVRKDNPTTGVRGPDEGAKRGKQFIYPSEFLALMACERVPQRWLRLVVLNVYLYCRAGELEALHVEDVDLAHRSVHIHRAVDRDHGDLKETKTNNPRRIPVEPHLLPLLQQLVAEARAAGRALLVEMPPLCDLAPRLRKYLGWAGVVRAELFRTTTTSKQLTWHDCRSTGATWLAIRGVAPQMIMALCGHENMETTMGYVRLAAVLTVAPESVFPAIPPAVVLPPQVPPGPASWGSEGGKLSRLLAFSGVPSGIRTPLESDVLQAFDRNSTLEDSGSLHDRSLVTAHSHVEGAARGQFAGDTDPDGAAALALVGRQVLATSTLWDALDADLDWLADPAAATGGTR